MIWATEAIFYKIQCYMIYHNHNDHLKTYGIYVSSSKLLKKEVYIMLSRKVWKGVTVII